MRFHGGRQIGNFLLLLPHGAAEFVNGLPQHLGVAAERRRFGRMRRRGGCSRRRRWLVVARLGVRHGRMHGPLLFQITLRIEGVRKDLSAAFGRERNHQALVLQRSQQFAEDVEVADRVHAGGASAEFAHGLLAAEQQFDHHGHLDLAHPQPLVEIVPVLLHPP